MQHSTHIQQAQKMSSTTVVLYPSSGIGHLVSMVELGKLIHANHPSLAIIILITPTPHKTCPNDKHTNLVSPSPSITFHHLPAIVLPPDFYSNHVDISFAIPELYQTIVYNTLVDIAQKSIIKAVILDFFSNAAFKGAKSLELPTYYFYTGGASGLCVFLHLQTLHKTTSKSIKDLNVYFSVPGVPQIHSSGFPSYLIDKRSNSYKKFVDTSINMAKSCGIIVYSFVGFEERAFETLRSGECIPDGPTPPVYLIGPLVASGNQVDCDENECVKWLDIQPSKSVVFLCFGSMGVFKKDQLKEIAIGLERSGQRFVWVVRNPPRDDENGSGLEGEEVGLDDILPQGFLARTNDKGLVVKNWAPQLAILSHESVGGFVSHCGWNSTLEAMVKGVPMVAWPLYAEQSLNRVYLVQGMKVALALEMSADGFVTAESFEKTTRELMEGEEGEAVKERVLEMSRRAKTAMDEGGSARVGFNKLTQSWWSAV